jgi:hypothetical protein
MRFIVSTRQVSKGRRTLVETWADNDSSLQTSTVAEMQEARLSQSALMAIALVLAAIWFGAEPATAKSGSSIPAVCPASALRVTEPQMITVAAGTVSELFLVENLSARACSISGYPRVVFRLATGVTTVIPFSDRREYGGGLGGGMRKSGPLPTSRLAALGGLASFWIYGTDESYGSPPVRCLTAPVMLVFPSGARQSTSTLGYKSNPFFWCGRISVFPFLPGRSGTYPAVPLHYFFGG